MQILVGVLVLLAALIAWMVLRARSKYGSLFRNSHFLELAGAIEGLKSAALDRRGEAIQSAEDPRVLVTSAGLTVFHTAEEISDQGQVLCHFSLSYRGGPLPWAAGGRYTYFILHQLGVPVETAVVAHSRAGVVHVAFLLSAEDALQYDRRRVRKPAEQELSGLKEKAGDYMSRTLRSGQILSDEEELLPRLLSAA